MIDFDKEREEIGKAYDAKMGKWLKEQEAKKQAEKNAAKVKHVQETKSKGAATAKSKKVNEKTKQTQKEAVGKVVKGLKGAFSAPETPLAPNQEYLTLSNGQKVVVQKGASAPQTVDWNKVKASNFGSAYTGAGTGLVNAFTGLPSAAASIATGKNVDISEKLGLTLKNDKSFQESGISNTTAYKGGELGGEMLGYVIQSGLANPLTSKVGNAVAKTRLGKSIAENAVDAATIGTLQNIGIGYQQGLRGKELAEDVVGNTLLDMGVGTGLSLAGAGFRTLRNAKNVDLPTKTNVPNQVVEPTAKVAETGDLGGSATSKNKPRTTEAVPDNEAKKMHTTSMHIEKSKSPDTRARAGYNNVPQQTSETTLPLNESMPQSKAKVNLPRKTTNPQAQAQDMLRELSPEFESQYEEQVSKLADYIREYKGKGSTTNLVPINEDNTGRAIRYTSSNNDDWYREALKKYGSNSAVNKHADEIAREIIDEELRLAKGQQAYADDYLYTLNEKGNRLLNIVNKELPKPGRKLKANGIPETHEKVGIFDVESSNIGFVNPDLQYVGEVLEEGKGLFDRFYKNIVSGQKELERLSKVSGSTKVDDYTQGVRSAKSTVTHIFHNGMVDASGKVVDSKSYRSLIDEIPKAVREDFNTYAQHLHNIDRIREGVPVFKQVSADQSQQIVDDMLKAHPEFAQYTKSINEWWNKFVKTWLVDTGRITQESYDAMLKKYPNYIPTYRVGKGYGGGSLPNKVNAGSGIKGAKGGTSDVIPLEDNFLAQIDRIVTSTRKNDLYASIIDTLKKDPEGLKAFGVLTDNKSVLDNDILDDLLGEVDSRGLKEVKNGVNMLTAYVDGKPVSAYINQDMVDALKLLENAYGSKYMRSFGEVGRKLTNPVKAGITGYNPLFAVANMMRDFPTLFIQSQHSMFKTTTGLFKALGAMVTNNDMYQTYKALGGKQGGYYAQGKGFEDALNEKGLKHLWSKIENAFSFIGETTETLPRMAEFINSVEKYGDSKDGLMRALKDASESTVNFSRSAPLTKTVDSWVLYLNAAMQGLDKFGRTVKNAPLKTLGRSAALISVPYATLMLANWDNPHYQDLTERIKQNYFCIPNVNGEKDSEGYAMTFIKVPVNREYGALLGSSLDIIYGMMQGQSWEEATKGYGETLKDNFAPPNPLEDHILAPITEHIPENKNYAGYSIVPANLEGASPRYQQDASTSGIAKGIAKVANNINDNLGVDLGDTLNSPMKVDYLIDQYGGYFGQVAQGMTNNNVENARTSLKEGVIEPFKQRFTADARYSSGVVSNFYDAKEANERAKADVKAQGESFGEANAKGRVYDSIADQLSDISKEEKAILADKKLSKAEKDKKIKALRTKRNEIARSAEAKTEAAAKEYRQAPTYSQLNSKIKEKYNSGVGLSKEKWAKAYNSQVKEKKTSVKVMNLLDNGVTSYEQAATINSNISETAFKEGKALKAAGVTNEQIKEAYVKANYDGNTSVSKAEAMRYLNGKDYTRAQKRAIFDALMSNPDTRNPY